MDEIETKYENQCRGCEFFSHNKFLSCAVRPKIPDSCSDKKIRQFKSAQVLQLMDNEFKDSEMSLMEASEILNQPLWEIHKAVASLEDAGEVAVESVVYKDGSVVMYASRNDL